MTTKPPDPPRVATQPNSAARWITLALGFCVVAAAVVFMHARHVEGPAQPSHLAVDAKTHRDATPIRPALRPKASVAGHVFDMEGKAFSGAQVCAFASPSKTLSSREVAVPRCTKSDAEGSYGLGDLFPATELVVSASAEGFAPARYSEADPNLPLRLLDGERRVGVDLHFASRGVEVRGSVSDVTGGAVSEAIVMSWGSGRAVGRSNAKGEFALWVAPGDVTVEATASGYAAGSARGPAPAHFFKIQLVPGATLVGKTVKAKSGEPLAAVFTEAIQIEGGYQRASSVTDEEGRFRIEGLTPGRYRVEANAERGEGYSRNSVTLALGETSSELVIEVEPAYVVKARVIVKETGEPCKTGSVTITDHDQNEYDEGPIDADGSVRMASVIPGTYAVDVRCTGRKSLDDYGKVVVRDRDPAALTLEVLRGASVDVEVVDAHGAPVTKASVSASPMAARDQSWASADEADADRTFHLTGLMSGQPYRVQVRREDGARAFAEATASESGSHLRVELPAAGSIEGIVEDGSKAPVSGAIVQVSGATFTQARSADDGTFVLQGLAPGDYKLKIYELGKPWNPDDETGVVHASVSEGAPAKVRLTAESHNGAIAGSVVDGTDKPVTDAFIQVSPGSGGSTRYNGVGAPVMTDTEGHFTVENLGEGPFTVRAYRTGGAEVTLEGVKAGTRDLVAKLEAAGSIGGTLSSPAGPVERFTVTVSNEKTGFSREELFFHAGGAFSIGELPAGTYKVVGDTPSGHAQTEVAIAAGEQKLDVALTLTMRGTVRGTVVSLEGNRPIAGAILAISGNTDTAIVNDPAPPVTGPDGRFEIHNVLPGSFQLIVTSSDTGDSTSLPLVVQESPVTEAGVVRMATSRLAPGQPAGSLGFYASPTEDGSLQVLSASGAAAEAGLQVGDIISSVDGYDVAGSGGSVYRALVTVPAGRSITLGLARGQTVTITAS